MVTLLREPLVHFLFAGLLLFAFYSLSDSEPEADSAPLDLITVDREALLNFMQFRAQAFDNEIFSERLDQMTVAQRQALIDDFVREEALYREALALNLDQGDYIIRQRLVQKVDYLLEDSVTGDMSPDDEELAEFFNARREDYRVDSVYTFTHIFFDSTQHGAEQARMLAADLLADPLMQSLSFSQAGQYGDRYPFLQNYVERTRDYVVNNFSEGFVDNLDELEVSDSRWYGPFASRYGYHLVQLRFRSAPTIPSLEQIRGRVLDDYRYEMTVLGKQDAARGLIDNYRVEVLLESIP